MSINKNFRLANGINITIHLTEEWDKIWFSVEGEALDGEFLFEDIHENQTVFLLKRLYSPLKYKRMKIGEESLKFFKTVTQNATIRTRENDGEVRGDGSNLTENAPSFIKKMQAIGLIEQWDSGGDDY